MDDKDPKEEQRARTRREMELDQSMAMFADRMPPLWWRMYRNLLNQGFSEIRAFELLKVYIAASVCTSGINVKE